MTSNLGMYVSQFASLICLVKKRPQNNNSAMMGLN